MDVREILEEVGYTNLKDAGSWFRTRPLYRDSDNDTVLAINKTSGYWYDYKECKGGKLAELISLSTNNLSIEDAEEILKSKYSFSSAPVKEKIKTIKYYDPSLLVKLVKDYSYWENRGINKEIVSQFQCGVAVSGPLKDRFVFPIFSPFGKIYGFTGRTLIDSQIKWKHFGHTKEWVYPVYFNKNQDYSTVLLIESIGDMLSLWVAGYKNTIVTFGLKISAKVINFLISSGTKKIIIAFNNDSLKNSAGNFAAEITRDKLLSFFDEDQIMIRLPPKKDFGEMSIEEIKTFLSDIPHE